MLLLLLPAAATTAAAVAASWLLLQYLPPHSNKARISELGLFDPRQSIFKEGIFAILAPTLGASPFFFLYLCPCFFILHLYNHTFFPHTLSKGGRVYLTFKRQSTCLVFYISAPAANFIPPSLLIPLYCFYQLRIQKGGHAGSPLLIRTVVVAAAAAKGAIEAERCFAAAAALIWLRAGWKEEEEEDGEFVGVVE